MQLIQSTSTQQKLPNDNYYYSFLTRSSHSISITITLNDNYLSTYNFPETSNLLKTFLPKVLKTKCFNYLNLPFHEEVKNTEMGHLFEHIMLSYLCELKIKNGIRHAQFSGLTEWNWKKDLKGTFHITIEIDPSDSIYIEDAYIKSQIMLDLICKSNLIKN